MTAETAIGMSPSDRNALLARSLERAAEQIGDITPVVAHTFYERFPDAPALFATLWPGSRDRLEGQMVETALYCIMNWMESPGEIEVVLMGTVPHHLETLKVPLDWFTGFLLATAEVVTGTIPADRKDERDVWDTLVTDLLSVIAASAA